MALLMPLALGAGHRQQGEKRQSSENDRLKEEIKRLKSSNSSIVRFTGGQSSKNKGKGKDNTRPRDVRGKGALPKDLLGMRNEVNGEKLCYNYNLPQKCSKQSEDRCERGLHRCMFPGCAKHHPLTHCPSKGSR